MKHRSTEQSKMSGISIYSGGIADLDAIFAKMTVDKALELSSMEEFAQCVKHPKTVDAVLIDPFDKTWRKVTLPLEIEDDKDEEEDEVGYQSGSSTSTASIYCPTHHAVSHRAIPWYQDHSGAAEMGQL